MQESFKKQLMPNKASVSQEADLHYKPWYAGACDRKSAEEALHRSNKVWLTFKFHFVLSACNSTAAILISAN